MKYGSDPGNIIIGLHKASQGFNFTMKLKKTKKYLTSNDLSVTF